MDRQQMLQRRFDGMTYTRIAEEAGISRQRVQQILRPPKAIRDLVVEQAQGRCASCGKFVGVGGDVHHLGAKDGDTYNEIANLRLVCVPCHMGQHSKDIHRARRIVTREAYKRASIRESVPAKCSKCGHRWLPRVMFPVKCPNPECNTPFPLGKPPVEVQP